MSGYFLTGSQRSVSTKHLLIFRVCTVSSLSRTTDWYQFWRNIHNFTKQSFHEIFFYDRTKIEKYVSENRMGCENENFPKNCLQPIMPRNFLRVKIGGASLKPSCTCSILLHRCLLKNLDDCLWTFHCQSDISKILYLAGTLGCAANKYSIIPITCN